MSAKTHTEGRRNHRADVLFCAAELLESAFGNGDGWLFVDSDTDEDFDHADMKIRKRALRGAIATLRTRARTALSRAATEKT